MTTRPISKSLLLLLVTAATSACAAPPDSGINSSVITLDPTVSRALSEGRPVSLRLSDLKASPEVKGIRVFVDADRASTQGATNGGGVYVGSLALYPAGHGGSFSLEASEALKQVLTANNTQSLRVTFVPDHATANESVTVARAALKPHLP